MEKSKEKSKVDVMYTREGSAPSDEVMLTTESEHIKKLEDRDFVFVMLAGALNNMLATAQEEGRGFPIELPVEAVDALREELEYCLYGGGAN